VGDLDSIQLYDGRGSVEAPGWKDGVMAQFLSTIVPLLPALRILHIYQNDTLLHETLSDLCQKSALSKLYFLSIPLPIPLRSSLDLQAFDFAADLPSLTALCLNDLESINASITIRPSTRRIDKLEMLALGSDGPVVSSKLLNELVRGFPPTSTFSFTADYAPLPSFEFLRLLPLTLESLYLKLSRNNNLALIDTELLRFPSLARFEIEIAGRGTVVSSNLHQTLLQLRNLRFICLPHKYHDLSSLKLLVSGPSRLPHLEVLMIGSQHWYGGGVRVKSPLAKASPSNRVYSHAKVEMEYWESPMSSSDCQAVRDLIEAGRESEVEIGGSLVEAFEGVEKYFIEANNRSVIHAYHTSDFSYLNDYRQQAIEYDISLPDFDIDSLGNDLEFVETKLPNWHGFVLSLKNRLEEEGEEDESEIVV
jgi:hypothetical protein